LFGGRVAGHASSGGGDCVADRVEPLGDELVELRGQYEELFTKVVKAQDRIAELSTSRTLREQQLELYRFQADEIDEAALDPAEYLELQSRASMLQNLEKLKKDAGAVHSSLYEMDGAVLERLKMMGAVLAELSVLDQQIKPTADSLREATISLEEVAFDLSRYLDKLDLDPGEITEVSDRLNTFNRILNKYGDPVEATLAHRQEIGQKPRSALGGRHRQHAGGRIALMRHGGRSAPSIPSGFGGFAHFELH